MMWPEVFTDPNFTYNKSDPNVIPCAICDGLLGWAACYMEKPPKQFGFGMLKVAEVLGVVDPSEEVLRGLAKKWQAEHQDRQIRAQGRRILES